MPATCDDLRREVEDVQMFASTLVSFANRTDARGPLASTLLVVLHNLVTSSIGRKFSSEGRRHLYCVPEVLEKLGQSSLFSQDALGADMPALQWDLRFRQQQPSLGALLGVGRHELRNCSDVP